MPKCPKCGSSMHSSAEYTWVWNNTYTWSNKPVWSNTKRWTNVVRWNNQIINTSERCYTSIQQGSWWYYDANNQVSTSGTRTYRSDGGASGGAGNAGFLIIVPPEV